MQFRKIFTQIFIVIIMMSAGLTQGQVIRDNERGERIVVYSDGSWRYFNENDPRDQALWEKQMKPVEVQPLQNQKPGDEVETKKKYTSPESDSYIDKIATKERKGQEEITTTRERPGVGMNRTEALQYINKAKSEESRAIKAEEEASLTRFFIEEDLDEVVNGGKKSTKGQEKLLRAQLKDAKLQEKVAKAIRREASKKVELASKLLDMDPEDRPKWVAKLENDRNANSIAKASERVPSRKSYDNGSMVERERPKSSDNQSASPNARSRTKKKDVKDRKNQRREERTAAKDEKTPSANKPTPVVKRPAPTPRQINRPMVRMVARKDVLRNPPPSDCKLAFDGIDEFTGKKRRDVADGLLFTYTSDRLKPYLKEKEFITCSAHLSYLAGGYLILFLDFVIASENAQREFGILEKGSPLILTFLDESKVQANNNKTDTGNHDAFNKVVRYTGQYLLGPDQAKALAKKELDKIRVVWSTGFEDYNIYEIDFFIDQFACLNAQE